jgi:hypothetical protein
MVMPEDQVKIKKDSSSMGVTCCSDGDHYPYGTSLNFDDDLVDDLDIGGLAVGDVVEVRGYAFVDGKSEHSNKEHSSKSVRLQMTSIKVNRETDDVVKQMYGE